MAQQEKNEDRITLSQYCTEWAPQSLPQPLRQAFGKALSVAVMVGSPTYAAHLTRGLNP